MGDRRPMTKRKLLAQVAEIATRCGVSLLIDLVDDSIRIYNIIRLPESPKGSGAKAIAELKTIAEDNDLNLELAAENGNFDLIQYYVALGFVSSQSSDMEEWLKEQRDEWEAHLANPEEVPDHANMIWKHFSTL